MRRHKPRRERLKIFLASPSSRYVNWIPRKRIVNNIEDADLVMFLGGEDVSPAIYGQKEHPKTSTNPKRDEVEVELYEKAKKLNKPILGICRGSQLICALQEKGMLIQDQNCPTTHYMDTYDGKKLTINSYHHQAVYPFNMDPSHYKILGWTEDLLYYHEDGNQNELNPKKECEVVFYPKTNCLGIQSHPEMLSYHNPSNEWMRELLQNFLNRNL